MVRKESDIDEFIAQLNNCGVELFNSSKPIYHYTSIDTAIKILTNSTLRFNSVKNVNDNPFEFTHSFLDFSLTREEMDIVLPRMLKEDKPDITEEEILNIMRIPHELAAWKTEMYFKKSREDSLIICFSGKNNDNLMWGLYGAHHKGVCLGFRILNNPDINKFQLLKANYSEKPKKVKVFTKDYNSKTIAQLYISTLKCKKWEFENEVRAIIPNKKKLEKNKEDNDYFDYKFPKEWLVEVHFGFNTSPEDITTITQLIECCNYQNIEKRKQIKPILGTYEMKEVDL